MESHSKAEFRTLLTKTEYERLIKGYDQDRFDYQTNHYFDTSRFSLKALDASLRVREREVLELILRKKKGYVMSEFKECITKEELNEMKETGYIKDSQIQQEIALLVGNQKIVNFMSLSTKRIIIPYCNGVVFIDENSYLGITDYELGYEGKNLEEGKKEFIALLKEHLIGYTKADKKIKRAYAALKLVN